MNERLQQLMRNYVTLLPMLWMDGWKDGRIDGGRGGWDVPNQGFDSMPPARKRHGKP